MYYEVQDVPKFNVKQKRGDSNDHKCLEKKYLRPQALLKL